MRREGLSPVHVLALSLVASVTSNALLVRQSFSPQHTTAHHRAIPQSVSLLDEIHMDRRVTHFITSDEFSVLLGALRACIHPVCVCVCMCVCVCVCVCSTSQWATIRVSIPQLVLPFTCLFTSPHIINLKRMIHRHISCCRARSPLACVCTRDTPCETC